MEQKTPGEEFVFKIEKTVTSMPELPNEVAVYEYCSTSGKKRSNLFKKVVEDKKLLIVTVCALAVLAVAAIVISALSCNKTSSASEEGEISISETTKPTETSAETTKPKKTTKTENQTNPTKNDGLQQVENNEKDKLSEV